MRILKIPTFVVAMYYNKSLHRSSSLPTERWDEKFTLSDGERSRTRVEWESRRSPIRQAQGLRPKIVWSGTCIFFFAMRKLFMWV